MAERIKSVKLKPVVQWIGWLCILAGVFAFSDWLEVEGSLRTVMYVMALAGMGLLLFSIEFDGWADRSGFVRESPDFIKQELERLVETLEKASIVWGRFRMSKSGKWQPGCITFEAWHYVHVQLVCCLKRSLQKFMPGIGRFLTMMWWVKSDHDLGGRFIFPGVYFVQYGYRLLEGQLKAPGLRC